MRYLALILTAVLALCLSAQAQIFSAEAPLSKIAVSLRPSINGQSLPGDWKILAYIPDHEGRHEVYATAAGLDPEFLLPQGRYVVVANAPQGSSRVFINVDQSARDQKFHLILKNAP